MGNDNSKIATDAEKFLATRGYKKQSVLSHSLLDKNMAGAAIWKKDRTTLDYNESEFVLVKEKFSMNAPEHNRIQAALAARERLEQNEEALQCLCRLYFQKALTDNSWCTNYYKTVTVSEYYPETLDFQVSAAKDMNKNSTANKVF